MRSLITGGRGFVGTWLAEHLSELGDEVVRIDQEVEITDLDALLAAVRAAAPDAIYHLAALTHVGQSWDEPLRVLEVNVIGTAALLAAARECGTDPRVLVTSSAEVYGPVTDPDRLPLREGSPTAPLTPYAASKLATEAVVTQAFLGHGQQVITVRPFNHVGPGQAPSFAVSALAKRIVDAERSGARSIPVGNLSARRDFTDVRDVVRAYRLLVESAPAGEVYNVCSGRDVSIDEIARQPHRARRVATRARDRSVAGTRGGGAGAARRPRQAARRDRLETRDPARTDPGRRDVLLARPRRVNQAAGLGSGRVNQAAALGSGRVNQAAALGSRVRI